MKHRILELRDGTYYPFDNDAIAPIVSAKDVLWMLEPSSSLGRFIMEEYSEWLKARGPSPYADPKDCKRWREYMFKRAGHLLSDLSKLMEDRYDG